MLPAAQRLDEQVADTVALILVVNARRPTRHRRKCNEIAPLLPPQPPKPKSGRPRIPDRAALTGIAFVPRTGCPWDALPAELGCGSRSTCWRRLRAWQAAGVWDRLLRTLRNRLGRRVRSEWTRASLDFDRVPASGSESSDRLD